MNIRVIGNGFDLKRLCLDIWKTIWFIEKILLERNWLGSKIMRKYKKNFNNMLISILWLARQKGIFQKNGTNILWFGQIYIFYIL